jgi:hypothetical protein
MDSEAQELRRLVIEEIEMLALPSKQLAYESSLRDHVGHAPTELINVFCNDLFNPKSPVFVDAFSWGELKELAHLYGLIREASYGRPSTVTEMLKDPDWRRVVAFAKDLLMRLKRQPRDIRRGTVTR